MNEEESRALRAALIDQAWAANKEFAMCVHARRTTPGANDSVVQLTVDQSIETVSATFKHFTLTLQVRPVIVSNHHAAVEYHVVAQAFGDPVDVGTFYVVPHRGGVFDNPEGTGDGIGWLNNVRTVDAIGGWLSDRIEHARLLAPRVQSPQAGIFSY